MIYRVTLDHDQRVVGTQPWNLMVPDTPEPLAETAGQLCYRFIEADTAEHAGRWAQAAAEQELAQATEPPPTEPPVEPPPEEPLEEPLDQSPGQAF